MTITIPPDYPGNGKAKVGDVLSIRVKVNSITNTGLSCELVQPTPPAKKLSAVDYLKSVNRKPITPTPKLAI